MDINVHVILDESPALQALTALVKGTLANGSVTESSKPVKKQADIEKKVKVEKLVIPKKQVVEDSAVPESPERETETETDLVLTEAQSQELRKKMAPLLKADKDGTMKKAGAWLKENNLERLSAMKQSQLPDFLKVIGAE